MSAHRSLAQHLCHPSRDSGFQTSGPAVGCLFDPTCRSFEQCLACTCTTQDMCGGACSADTPLHARSAWLNHKPLFCFWNPTLALQATPRTMPIPTCLCFAGMNPQCLADPVDHSHATAVLLFLCVSIITWRDGLPGAGKRGRPRAVCAFSNGVGPSGVQVRAIWHSSNHPLSLENGGAG